MGDLNPNYSVSFGAMGSISTQMKGIGSGFHIIYAFLYFFCNFFIHSKISLFEGDMSMSSGGKFYFSGGAKSGSNMLSSVTAS